ncbi:hypothetical protein M758_6G184600 [Ceratodon purpureus]|nr:hypothetical protein M758_6G184600 [Ceratodon purpureus]
MREAVRGCRRHGCTRLLKPRGTRWICPSSNNTCNLSSHASWRKVSDCFTSTSSEPFGCWQFSARKCSLSVAEAVPFPGASRAAAVVTLAAAVVKSKVGDYARGF